MTHRGVPARAPCWPGAHGWPGDASAALTGKESVACRWTRRTAPQSGLQSHFARRQAHQTPSCGPGAFLKVTEYQLRVQQIKERMLIRLMKHLETPFLFVELTSTMMTWLEGQPATRKSSCCTMQGRQEITCLL